MLIRVYAGKQLISPVAFENNATLPELWSPALFRTRVVRSACLPESNRSAVHLQIEKLEGICVEVDVLPH